MSVIVAFWKCGLYQVVGGRSVRKGVVKGYEEKLDTTWERWWKFGLYFDSRLTFEMFFS